MRFFGAAGQRNTVNMKQQKVANYLLHINSSMSKNESLI